MSRFKSRTIRAVPHSLAVFLATPAYAQIVDLPEPPANSPIDEQNVDLASGEVKVADPQLSIGTPDNGLSYTRFWNGEKGWAHNYLIYWLHDQSGTSDHLKVVIGNYSESFTYNEFTPNESRWESDGSTGSSVDFDSSGRLKYRKSDGTEIEFDTVGTEVYYGGINGIAKSIKRPTGQKINFDYRIGSYSGAYPGIGSINGDGIYKFVRLQSVRNSFGFQLKYFYATNSLSASSFKDWGRITNVKAINSAIDYCEPAADSCSSLTQTWPSVSYAESASGTDKIESVTDPEGRVRKYVSNSSGKLIGVRRPASPLGNSLTYSYDGSGRVSSVAVDGVGTWNYAFALSGETMTATITTPTLPGNPRVVVLNTQYRLPISVTDENGRTTQYRYCPPSGSQSCFSNLLYKITYPEGNSINYSYSSGQIGGGNLIWNLSRVEARPKVGTSSWVQFSANYPEDCTIAPYTLATCGKPISTVDAAGNITDYHYNTDGTIGYVKAPAPAPGQPRPEVHYSYVQKRARFKGANPSLPNEINDGPDLIALPETTTSCISGSWPCSASGQTVSQIQYASGPSATNLQVQSTTVKRGDDSEVATTSFGYSAVGDLTSVAKPLGQITTMAYAADRQLTSVTSPSVDGTSTGQKRRAALHYNGDGQLDSTTVGPINWDGSGFSPVQKTLTEYDVAGRVKAERLTDGAGTTTFSLVQRSYNGAGRLECETVRMNSVDFGAPPAPCLLGTPDVDGQHDRIKRYLWENAGSIERVQSGYGTSLQQDEIRYTRTANGFVNAMIDAKGNVTSYAYDGYDRQLRECFNASAAACQVDTATDVVRLSYDSYGRPQSRSLRGQSQIIGLAYDNIGRVKTVDYPGSSPFDADITYTYDNLGRMTQAADAGGHVATFGYDALGRVTSQGDAVSVRTMLYDANGRRIRQTWPDGRYITYQYNDADEMKAILESGSSVLATFGYDAIGRRISLTRGNGTVTYYDYDGASRLNCLRHDAVGGSTLGCAPATATGQDQALAFTYNPAGQIRTRVGANDAYAFTLHYNVNRNYTVNPLNQYTASGSVAPTYDLQGNLKTAGGTATYTYSAGNHLVQRDDTGVQFYHDPLGRLERVLNAPGGSYGLQYVDGQISDEFAVAPGNPILRRYVYGPTADEPIVWYEGADFSNKRYLLADERGSIVAVTDSSGAATAINRYDEYGIPAGSNQGRFQFTGQAWLSELGMYSFKARIYSPTFGRFLQTDPAGYPDGPNWYNYAKADPINRKDPSGNDDCSVVCQAGGGLPTDIYVPGRVSSGYSLFQELSRGISLYTLLDNRERDLLYESFEAQMRAASRPQQVLPQSGKRSGPCAMPGDVARAYDAAKNTAFRMFNGSREIGYTITRSELSGALHTSFTTGIDGRIPEMILGSSGQTLVLTGHIHNSGVGPKGIPGLGGFVHPGPSPDDRFARSHFPSSTPFVLHENVAGEWRDSCY